MQRSVQLRLPSRLNGKPILPSVPAFPRHDLIFVRPFHWNSQDCFQPCGYLTPDHRTAIINYTDGACAKLTGITTRIHNGVALITLYQGETQTFFALITIGYGEVTFIRLPHQVRRIVDGPPP